jgi:hypothetical protein
VLERDDRASTAVLIPWIDAVPFDSAPWVIQGWKNIISAHDTEMNGFLPTVNEAMRRIVQLAPAEWVLIWNSDAWPQFTQEELEKALLHVPAFTAVAAPLKIPNDDAVQVTGKRIEGRLFLHWNITDTGPLAVSTVGRPWPVVAHGLVSGTGYSPLYAVRPGLFHWLGGLNPLYGPGYFDDAHFWRLCRRMGFETCVLLGLTYRHDGEKSFRAAWDEGDLRRLQAENLKRYLLSWGALERRLQEPEDQRDGAAEPAGLTAGREGSAAASPPVTS